MKYDGAGDIMQPGQLLDQSCSGSVKYGIFNSISTRTKDSSDEAGHKKK